MANELLTLEEAEQYRRINEEQRMADLRYFAGMKSPRLPTGAPDWTVLLPPPWVGGRVPMPVPSKQAVAVSTLDPGCDEEYRALVRELGGSYPEIVNADLEAFLAENMIEEYPLDSVIAYMNNLCCDVVRRPFNRFEWFEWHWHPYREQDVIKGGGDTWGKQYRQPVPYPVLLTIRRIVRKFKDAVRFCVTEVEEVKDPFLAVGAATAEGVFKFHVIERWDEPKYRP